MISQAKKLELITKHAKHFTTKKGVSTPVLEGVHYNVDGSVVCTDRHVLLRIGGAHNFTEEFTSHAKTGSPIDGNYPDTSRTIPQDLPTQITLISNGFKHNDLADMIARVKVAFEAAKLTGNRTYITKLTVIGADVKLSVNNAHPSVNYSTGISADISGKDVEVAFNASFLLNALNVFKDAGSARVIIGITGEASPIVLRDKENEIDVVVLPIRIPKGDV